ncbi:MAG TPA: glycosyl transferase, partial [Candidatus Nitrosotalea sp.]|nr:glycosyl transferase [Candidatus Nitrosotalea sp.]
MSDFFQTGAIATLHRLGQPKLARLEEELEGFSLETPMALVLPCHIKEMGTPALNRIINALKGVTYIKQIVVGVDAAGAREWHKVRRYFRRLPQRPTLLWNSGPRMQTLFRKLDEAELNPGSGGKGRNLWICFGYVLASEQASMVVAHDCDIVTYERELLARLCYPVAHPNLGFDFCKGYYARYTTKLNGRVMRLLV